MLIWKGIFIIRHATLMIGVEKPIFLHAVCYERLQENAGSDK